MATSVGSGDWSAAGTWDTGVPTDGASVIVAAGHEVAFDVDQSAFATGITLRIDGILTVKSGGTRYMKLAGHVTFGASGIREWRIGTAETPYAATDRFTLDLNGAHEVTLTDGAVRWYESAPIHSYVKIAGATEAAGQTVLSVDTDVTAETNHWFDGAEVRIDRVVVPGTSAASELRTIATAGVAAETITITAGLTAQKEVGSFVHLITRNIRVIGQTGAGRCFNSGIGSHLGCELRPASGAYGVYYGSGHIISGTVSGCAYGLCAGSGHIISGTISGCTKGPLYGSGHIVSGTISGCTYGLYYGSGYIISGTISGCDYGLYYSSGHIISGTVSSCAYGVYYSSGHIISGTVSGCTYGVYYGGFTAVGMTFSGNVVDVLYLNLGPVTFDTSFRHGGVAGDYRSWAYGGYAATDTTVNLGGRDSIKLTMQDAARHARAEEPLSVQGVGGLLTIEGVVRLGVTGMTYRPRIQLVAPGNDPLAGQSALAEFLPADSTDDQAFMLQYTPDAGDMRPVVVRFIGGHASGNAWASWWRRETFGAPGVMSQMRRAA